MAYPKNIFAYTAPSNVFPEYISVNIWDGGVQITVRSSVDDGGGQAMIRMPLPQLDALAQALTEYVAAERKPVVAA